MAITGAAGAAPACAQGAYRSTTGDLLFLGPAPTAANRQRYTRLNGEQGEVAAADANVKCANGVVLTDSGVAWTRLEFRETPATFTAPDGVRLNALLMEPLQSEGKPPLVIYSHGSEHTSAIRTFYQYVFAAQGVSTFFYDKRGTGGSGGAYSQNFSILADDAAAAASEARRVAAGRFSRLGYWGGSQGGWVAPAAALKFHADFVEVAFGMVATPLEQDQWQVDYQMKAAGFPDSILPAVHEVTDATARVAASKFKAHFEELAALRAKYGRERWFDKIDGQYSGELLRNQLDFAAYEEADVPWHYRSEEVLRQLRVPQLWMLAAEDAVAPSAHTIERLQALRRSGADIEIVVYPDTDHGIHLYTTNAAGERKNAGIADGYLKLIADWAKGTKAPSDGAPVK